MNQSYTGPTQQTDPQTCNKGKIIFISLLVIRLLCSAYIIVVCNEKSNVSAVFYAFIVGFYFVPLYYFRFNFSIALQSAIQVSRRLWNSELLLGLFAILLFQPVFAYGLGKNLFVLYLAVIASFPLDIILWFLFRKILNSHLVETPAVGGYKNAFRLYFLFVFLTILLTVGHEMDFMLVEDYSAKAKIIYEYKAKDGQLDTNLPDKMAISHDGRYAAFQSKNLITIWDFNQQKLKGNINSNTDTTRSIEFSFDSTYLLVGGGISDTKNPNLYRTSLGIVKLADYSSPPNFGDAITSESGYLSRVIQNSNGKYLAYQTPHKARLINLSNGSDLILSEQRANIQSDTIAGFSKNGELLVTYNTKYYNVVDVFSANIISSFQTQEAGIRAHALNPVSQEAAFIKFTLPKYTMEVLSLSDKAIVRRIQVPSDIISICYSPDGKTIAGLGLDLIVRLWNSQTGKLVKKIKVSPERSMNNGFIGFSADGRYFIFGGLGYIKQWESNLFLQ